MMGLLDIPLGLWNDHGIIYQTFCWPQVSGHQYIFVKTNRMQNILRGHYIFLNQEEHKTFHEVFICYLDKIALEIYWNKKETHRRFNVLLLTH